jgi:membrane protease YdiL (CAAX protease family)
VHGTLDFSRYLSLTPALLAVAGTNAFLEELLFRGLLMSKLNIAFGPYLSTFLQAVIFASWHVGITYTPYVLVFVVLYVFPVGLLAGYLTRSSGSILPSWIFHAGVDIPIYPGVPLLRLLDLGEIECEPDDRIRAPVDVGHTDTRRGYHRSRSESFLTDKTGDD